MNVKLYKKLFYNFRCVSVQKEKGPCTTTHYGILVPFIVEPKLKKGKFFSKFFYWLCYKRFIITEAEHIAEIICVDN